ncbi:hypothetical protein N7501_002888 [Penicillium viridicatum]|nr:hypothetical protein N7501_002888 [Penicillium viridicatum]
MIVKYAAFQARAMALSCGCGNGASGNMSARRPLGAACYRRVTRQRGVDPSRIHGQLQIRGRDGIEQAIRIKIEVGLSSSVVACGSPHRCLTGRMKETQLCRALERYHRAHQSPVTPGRKCASTDHLGRGPGSWLLGETGWGAERIAPCAVQDAPPVLTIMSKVSAKPIPKLDSVYLVTVALVNSSTLLLFRLRSSETDEQGSYDKSLGQTVRHYIAAFAYCIGLLSSHSRDLRELRLQPAGFEGTQT